MQQCYNQALFYASKIEYTIDLQFKTCFGKIISVKLFKKKNLKKQKIFS